MLPVGIGIYFKIVLSFMPGVPFLKPNSWRSDKGFSIQSMTDEEIVAEYSQNVDKYLIGVLFDRYIHLVYAGCMKYLKDEENARDAAMEIFEGLTDKLLKYKIDHFKSWLYTTTRNYCLMEFRKRRPVERLDNNKNIRQLSVEFDDILHLNNEDNEIEELLLQCLSELKEEQKVCLELMYLKGLSYKDIATETGYDFKNVKSHIQNGKRNLRLMLEQHVERLRNI